VGWYGNWQGVLVRTQSRGGQGRRGPERVSRRAGVYSTSHSPAVSAGDEVTCAQDLRRELDSTWPSAAVEENEVGLGRPGVAWQMRSSSPYASLPDRFDVILDCAGTSSYFHARRVLARGGAYLTTLPGPGALLGQVLAPLFTQRVVMVVVKFLGSDGEQLAGLVGEGKVRPVLSRTLTLDEVPAALEAMRLGQRVPGKQAVRIR